MKSLIISAILFLLSTNAFSQTLTTIWTRDTSWGGTSDKITRSIWKPSGLYINGWKSGNPSLSSYGATTKYNSANGNTLWSKIDTVTLTYSGLPFCVLENAGKVFSVSSSLYNSYFYLVVRNKNTGEMEKIKQVEWHMSLCEYKDSVVAIVSKNPARVIVYNANADSIRGFNLGYSLANGFVTGKTAGNYLWIMGNFYSGAWYFFVEKRNLLSGQVMWRRNFPVSSINLYGDVDSNGTAYLGTFASSSNACITKIDSSNTIVWEREFSQTENFAYRDLSINYKKNLILACGTNGNIGYIIGRDLQTGDSVFQFSVIWSAGATENIVSSIANDTTGDFYISGHHWNSTIQCHTRKYKYDTLTGIIIAVNENPEEFQLAQNYPNPFNPTTKINFSIPKKNHATITVYDILGKEVATLVNESLHPGTYETTFDASNLNSGIYFYRLQSGNFSATKKMLMIK